MLTARSGFLRTVQLAAMLLAVLHVSSAHTQPAAAGGGQYRVNGTAVDAISGQPLRAARVTLQSVKTPEIEQSMLTDENGRFDFQHVPEGKYSLEGGDARHSLSRYQQHESFWTGIVTGENLVSTDLLLKLVPFAILTGRVTDESGEGVRHAAVTIYLDNHSVGIERVQKFKSVQTDDLGTFEFSHLEPGNYFVSVTATPWYAVHPRMEDIQSGASANLSMLDVAYPVTYYAGATDSDSATPIPIKAADRLKIDIDLHPVPAVHLRVHVPGDERSGIRFPALQSKIFDEMEMQPGMEEQAAAQDIVELSGIPPGRYTLQLAGPGAERIQTVNLTTDTALDVEAAEMQGGAEVAGSVRQTAGRASTPVFISLRATGSVNGNSAQVDEKGEFAFHGIAPGAYEVLAGSSEPGLAVAHMSINGKPAVGNVLTIADNSNLKVVLQLAEGKATVVGFARRDGHPAAGAMIVLVPHDPDANRELFRRDQSDSDGSFELQNVVAGAYTLVAIEDGWNLNWAEGSVLARYLPKGLTVQISPQGTETISLPRPVEAQPRE